MNDLDNLMARVDAINAKTADELTADDIDTIILYHRRNRARKAAGEKPNRPTVDLSSLVKELAPPKPAIITRRL